METKLLIHRSCPLCGSDDAKLKYKRNYNLQELKADLFSARRERKKLAYEHNTFLKCKKCGMIYANPILNPSIVEKLYQKSKYNYGAEEENLKKSYGQCLQRVKKYIKSPKALLDIGTGNGFLLIEAISQGYDEHYVSGIEPSKHAWDLADKRIKNNIVNDILRENQFKKESFDTICLFQVIDHLENPNEIIRICSSYLKKGGVIICISHNVESLSARIMGEKSPIFDIEHTQLFSKKTISKIMENNGLKTKEITEVSNTYSMGYWVTFSPLPKFIKSPIKRILSAFGLLNKNITIKPGNFCAIAQKI